MKRTRQLIDQRRSEQGAKANQAAMAEENKHVAFGLANSVPYGNSIQFGNSVWYFGSAIGFDYSVVAIKFGNLVW
jgi:hypothetical protein